MKNPLGTAVLKIRLKNHFKDVEKDAIELGIKNVVTDYPTMHKFLIEDLHLDHKYHNIVYHRLTHNIVPELIKEGIFFRIKSYDSRNYFRINFKKII